MLKEKWLSSNLDFESNSRSAKEYWDDQLESETLIDVRQDKECLISVVVPVHNEESGVLLRQLRSIVSQEDISPNQFEAIYVINNSPDVNPEVVAKNSEVLKLPIWRNRKDVTSIENYPQDIRELLEETRRFNLFAIDKSSSGNEIVGCNVGKARNRGLAEASRRFFMNGMDGLILQIDADSYYQDPAYFRKVINQFKENPELIAICGGVKLYCDVETYTDKQKERSRPEISLLCDYLRWKSLKFLLLGKSFVLDDDFMSGPNMITKSFPSAAVHGVPNQGRAEDVAFGERLRLYAKKYGLQYSLEGSKDSFQVYSLLRLSGGLSNNLGANIKVDDSGLVYEHDANGKIVFSEFPDYKTAKIEPIPRLYDKFKQLALENCENDVKERIGEIERKIELNRQFLLQQLSE